MGKVAWVLGGALLATAAIGFGTTLERPAGAQNSEVAVGTYAREVGGGTVRSSQRRVSTTEMVLPSGSGSWFVTASVQFTAPSEIRSRGINFGCALVPRITGSPTDPSTFNVTLFRENAEHHATIHSRAFVPESSNISVGGPRYVGVRCGSPLYSGASVQRTGIQSGERLHFSVHLTAIKIGEAIALPDPGPA